LAAENTELHDKIDALKKELIQVQRHLSEEQAKYKRDTQSLADSKKHLNAELNTKYSEIQKLSNQLDERAQALKKSESQLANVSDKLSFSAYSLFGLLGAKEQCCDCCKFERSS
jgi:DNA repair exonuclease SbcCD ATPase subunit